MAIPTPYSYRQYTGDGTAKTFSVPFPYLDRTHVHVYLGHQELAAGTGYTWTSGTQLELTAPPTGTLTVRRQTPEDLQIVQWKDGSYIVQADLNESDLQWLYVLQEHHDQLMLLEWALGSIPGGGSPSQSLAFWSRLARHDDPGKGTPSEIAGTVDTADQKAGDWVTDDKHVATTGAVSERFDVIMSDTKPPDPTAPELRQGGKLWVDTLTLSISYWDPAVKAWVNTASSGPVGPIGPVGPAGAAGAQGAPGPVGPAGPQGPQGAQGPAGTGINLQGTVPTAAGLPAGASVGDAYVATDTGHIHVWTGSSWTDAGPIRGPEGPQGPVGPQGIQGVKGDKGDPGVQGPAGPEGPAGPAGLAGPKGDTGAQGPAGDPASITISGTAPIQVTGTPGAPVISLDQSNLAALSIAQSFSGLQTFNGGINASSRYSSNIVAVAALNIDCSLGNYFTKTIAGDSTFTVTNVPAGRSYGFTLELTHTSGAVTWFTGVQWPGGTAPTLTTGKVHLMVFHTDDGGVVWRGTALANYAS